MLLEQMLRATVLAETDLETQPHLKVVAAVINRESNEVQDIFISILHETYAAAETHDLIVDNAATIAAKPQEVKNVGYVRQAYNK